MMVGTDMETSSQNMVNSFFYIGSEQENMQTTSTQGEVSAEEKLSLMGHVGGDIEKNKEVNDDNQFFYVKNEILEGEMRKAIDEISRTCEEDMARALAIQNFIYAFEEEVHRVVQHMEDQQESYVVAARALMNETDAVCNQEVNDSCVCVTTGSSLRSEADRQVEACVLLDRLMNQNHALLMSLATNSDCSQLQTSCVQFLLRKLALMAWEQGGGICPSLMMHFSDIYQNIRFIEETIDGQLTAVDDAAVWSAPSTFRRKTSKYWVENSKLTELLLCAVREAPLLVYGKKGKLSTQPDLAAIDETKSLWDSSLVTLVTSVYCDSPNLDLYKERLKRSEGAKLLRVRWYGNRKPVGDEPIFLELKTHHEKWTNMKSEKERLIIRERDMIPFLQHKNTWTAQDAEDMVLAGKPNLTGEKLEEATELLWRMRQLVVQWKLRPIVRTTYLRIAFQSQTNNQLRLTVDNNVTVMRERSLLSSPAGEECSWCLSDEAMYEDDTITKKTVPYAVFEVKLNDSDKPDSIQALIENEVVLNASKFSKFLTGAAALYSNQIETLPYWADTPAFKEMFFDRRGNGRSGSVSPLGALTRTTIATNSSSSTLQSNTRYQQIDSGTRAGGSPSNKLQFQDPPKADTDANSDTTTTVSSSQGNNPKRIDGMAGEFMDDDVEQCRPQQQQQQGGGAGGGGEQWTSTAVDWIRKKMKKDKPAKTIAPRKAGRVEPKTYFANERTFLSWISSSLLLVTISTFILNLQSDTQANLMIAIFLVSCSGSVVMYAMFVYQRRLRLIQSGAPYGYVDHMGPLIMAICVLMGIFIILVHLSDFSHIAAPTTIANNGTTSVTTDSVNITTISTTSHQSIGVSSVPSVQTRGERKHNHKRTKQNMRQRQNHIKAATAKQTRNRHNYVNHHKMQRKLDI